MRLQLLAAILLICSLAGFKNTASAQSAPCDMVQIAPNPNPPVLYSPDSSKYLVNIQDTAGIFQIYVGDSGSLTTTCISMADTNGNCCGLFRQWKTRNKLQVQWHASGDFIICAVEKEFYNELLFVPYDLRLGWLQSGIWMDIWAVKPDGSHWYQLAATEAGVTGPAFSPDGNTGVWAEGRDSSDFAVDEFGLWKLNRSEFEVNNGVPSFSSTTNITPAGARWVEPGNFAPDGERVLITADIGMSNAEGQDQFILNINTGSIINLNNSPMIWDEHGVFSPDGNKILFMTSYPYQSDTNSYHTLSIKTEFMLMNPDGSGLQQLTHFLDSGYVESSPGIAATGFWTHDGSRIYAQSLVFPNYLNWIIDFEGNCGNAALSAEEEESKEFRMYPNPVAQNLVLETDFDLGGSTIRIVNTLGQTLKTFSSIEGNRVTIAMDELSDGLYILQFESKDNIISRCFVKE